MGASYLHGDRKEISLGSQMVLVGLALEGGVRLMGSLLCVAC